MKIGIFSPYFDTMTGGERYMFTIASCLSKKHEVYILWNDKAIVSKAVDRFGLDLEKVEVRSNIFDSSVNIIKRQKESFFYDLIIFLSDGSIPIVSSKKLLIHFQFPVEWVNAKNPKVRLKKMRISSFVCNSYFTKKYIDRKFGVKSDVLYPPADIVNQEGDKENIILTVGRFNRLSNGTDFKKLKDLSIAFRELKNKGLSSWRFVIVTNVIPDQKSDFNKFLQSINAKDIEVRDNVSRKELINLYSISKIYWHAAGFGEDLNAHPERAEHFGISTVEAMSAGCVPIVINEGGQKEIVENEKNGLLWESLDELISKTREVVKNDKLWSKLSEGAKKKSLDFGKGRFCEELNHLIHL